MAASLDQLQKEWKTLIGAGRFADLFVSMTEQLNASSRQFNTFAQLKGRHSNLHNDNMRGILSTEDHKIALNQISNDLLGFIDTLSPADVAPSSEKGEYILDKLARELEVQDRLSPLSLVNCNRQDAIESFSERYSHWESLDQKHQYYFIVSCSSQEPEGFSERVVYELQGTYDHSLQQGFKSRKYANAERLSVDLLPFNALTLDNCKEAFKKYFASRFDLKNKSFEAYLQEEVPLLKFEHATLVLKITSGQWNKLMESYLQWIIETFAALPAKAPRFLFFFNINLKDAHKEKDAMHPRNQQTFEQIQQFIARNVEHALLIAPLHPVPVLDFEEWLELVDAEDDQKDDIIQAIAERLKADEKTYFESRDQSLYMQRIHDFQKRVYKFHS